MPERNTSFDALFLRSKDSPSGDRIATMLCSEEGIIDAFVFGGSRSSLRSSASPFVFAKVFVYSDPVKHYRKLSDMAIIESFTGLRDSYAKLWSASLIAELIVKSALIRKESRGLHYMVEYPARDDVNWRKDTVLQKNNG